MKHKSVEIMLLVERRMSQVGQKYDDFTWLVLSQSLYSSNLVLWLEPDFKLISHPPRTS